MDSVVSFLHNDIVMSVLGLFGGLYSGFVVEENTTYLHTLLQNEYFKYGFIVVFMYMFTRQFVFSVVLTALFYIFFHGASYYESKNTPVNQPVEAELDIQTTTNNYSVSNQNNVQYNFKTRADMYNSLQTNATFESPNQPRFIDNQLKPENIQAYSTSTQGADYLPPPTF